MMKMKTVAMLMMTSDDVNNDNDDTDDDDDDDDTDDVGEDEGDEEEAGDEDLWHETAPGGVMKALVPSGGTDTDDYWQSRTRRHSRRRAPE